MIFKYVPLRTLKWIINYLFFVLLGILLLVKWKTHVFLNIAHIYGFVNILYSFVPLINLISRSTRLFFCISAFFCFIFWSAIVHLYYIISRGGVLIYGKTFFTFIILNITLGLLAGLAIQKCSVEDISKVVRSNLVIMLVTSSLIIYLMVSGSYYEGWLGLTFEDYEDFYQTIAGYGARIILTYVFMLCVIKELQKKAKFYINIILFIFIITLFSFLLGSKKEVILFLVLILFILYIVYRLKSIAYIFSLFCFSYFIWLFLNEEFIESFHFLGDLDRSTSQRADYLKYFSAQFEQSGLLGNPFIWMDIGGIYPHSFLLSLFQATGVPGLVSFSIMLFYSLFHLFKNFRFDIAFVLMLIFMMANISTYFDYFVFWYFFGLSASLLIQGRHDFSIVKLKVFNG